MILSDLQLADESQGSLYVPEEGSQSEPLNLQYQAKRKRTTKKTRVTPSILNWNLSKIDSSTISIENEDEEDLDADNATSVSTIPKLYIDDNSLSERKKKSLHHLTMEFVRFVKMQPNNTINVQTASTYLNVEKRRIYDITNALIGAQLLEKKGKSLYKWIGNDSDTQNEDIKSLYVEEGNLFKEAQQLDMIYEELKNQIDDIKKTTMKMDSAYVTKNQLMSLYKNRDQTIFALMGAPGTEVQTSCDINADGSHSYELYLYSNASSLETYLVHYVEPPEGTPPSPKKPLFEEPAAYTTSQPLPATPHLKEQEKKNGIESTPFSQGLPTPTLQTSLLASPTLQKAYTPTINFSNSLEMNPALYSSNLIPYPLSLSQGNNSLYLNSQSFYEVPNLLLSSQNLKPPETAQKPTKSTSNSLIVQSFLQDNSKSAPVTETVVSSKLPEKDTFVQEDLPNSQGLISIPHSNDFFTLSHFSEDTNLIDRFL